MKHVCEIIVKDVLPALRALLAKKLLEEENLTQSEAAKKLGMTQPAMSQYENKLRGYKVKMLEQSEDVSKWIDEICEETIESEGPIQLEEELCEICTKIRDKGILEDKYDLKDPKVY